MSTLFWLKQSGKVRGIVAAEDRLIQLILNLETTFMLYNMTEKKLYISTQLFFFLIFSSHFLFHSLEVNFMNLGHNLYRKNHYSLICLPFCVPI